MVRGHVALDDHAVAGGLEGADELAEALGAACEGVVLADQAADAVEAVGADATGAEPKATAVPIFTSSLRGAPDDLLAELGTLDALIVTVLAAGGTKPATATAGGDDEAWDVSAIADLDIPVLQGLCLTWDRATWAASDDGVSPLDAATQVAVPEFDGRIITTAFSFKETDEEGLPRYVADPERCRRVARTAAAHARLRHTPPAERKIALVLLGAESLERIRNRQS